MKLTKSLVLLALVVLAGACKQPEKTVEKTFLPYPIHQHQLPNGLNVVTVPYDSPGLVAFYIVVRVGSRNEVEPGKTGFAHFFEHMMFRGTEKFPPKKYNKILKATGAGANANTWFDRTVYHMTGNAAKLDQMFEIEADRFQHLKYSEADFKVEAGAVKGEYTKDYASQFSQLEEAVNKTAFTTHTYRHTTMGFFEDVVDMPNQYEYSLEFYNRFYRPEYTTLIVVGDVKPEEVNELAEKYFGSWEKGNYQADIPEEPEQTGTRYTHIQNPGFIPTVSLNYKAPGFVDTSREVAALDLVAYLLFSERSDLYKKLVINEQKAMQLYGYYLFTVDPYLFQIVALVPDENNLQYVKNQIVAAIDSLKGNPVDSLLLAQTKSNVKYSMAMSLDNPESIAENLSFFTWLTGNPESLNRYMATFEAVTPEDVQAAARKYLVPEKLTVATISSKEEGGVQ